MEERKDVLLITYYWPPSGGAGVHRWLRFSRYFSRYGVNLTVYCPEDAAWPVIDNSLSDKVPSDIKVIRRKIFEPQKFLTKGTTGVGFTEQKKASVIKKLIIWVRGNLFIPDSRVFWIKPSIKYLRSYLKDHPEITTIISTGPPHSMHLIALALKRELKLRWIADFRDPWTQIDFYQDLLPGKRADLIHKKLEKQCLSEADEVITVSNACASGFRDIVDRKIHVITNGYEFPDFDPSTVSLDDKFTICHFGSMPFTRNPEALWRALTSLLKDFPALKEHLEIKLVGTVDYKVVNSAKTMGLEEFVKICPPVDHEESISQQRSAQILLLAANNSGNVKGILTGKFFEYLGANRPVLALGMKGGDLNDAMESTKAGCFAGFEEPDVIYDYLKDCFDKYKRGELHSNIENTSQYSSAHLAGKVAELI